jgi:signal transduction histidine kinase
MAKGAGTSRRKLGIALAAVFVPLAALLVVQFFWLSRLERMSALAHEAALGNYLDAVAAASERHWREAVERSLDLPAAMFTDQGLEKVAAFWSERRVEGARRMFLADFTRVRTGNFLVFAPESGALETPPASDESLAMILAVTPWMMVSANGTPVTNAGMTVDERNPEARLLLRPVLDDRLRVVGVAGLVVDREWFVKEFLPKATRKFAPEYFPGIGPKDLVVTVRDDRGTILYRDGVDDGTKDVATSKFPMVFQDWTLGVHARRATSAQMARTGFLINVAFSLVLGGAVVAGLVLALRAAGRAVRLSEMKSDFVSNVSHELRTPVASIRVFAELLKSGRVTDDAKVREYGTYIETESRRLSRLIDNILDFSRIESGRKTYRFAEGRLEEVVEAVVDTFRVRLAAEGFELSYQGPDPELPEMPLDADAIGQAVHNLLDNAVKYSGDARTIEVRLRRRFDDALIEVQDHGIGIPRDEQRHVFDRFHRVGTGLVHDVKGSGLGLSITRHVVEAHGGSVHVDSEPGSGSTFTIRLPLERAQANKE